MEEIRQLDAGERKISEKSLERLKKDVKASKQNLEYNKDLLKKQEYLRKFDDRWRNFLRDQKEHEDKEVFKVIESSILEKENTIKELVKQLNEGVLVKNSAVS